MTTTMTPRNLPGGSSDSPRFAEDILADQGGVIRKRGAVSIVQDSSNGYSQMRQHFGQHTHRPSPSDGAYPDSLWMVGMGAETDGYGSLDSGGGTYINLDRSREGVYVTQSWWWHIMAPQDGAVGVVQFHEDSEGWRSVRRNYFSVELNLGTKELRLRPDGTDMTSPNGNAGVQRLVATDVPVPGWNDNKFDSTYTSLTTYIGPSTATGEAFGHYVAFQIGSTVYDLRGAGGGSAAYPPSQVSQPGSSFSGGRNPGISYTTPLPGVWGGIGVHRMVETIGDTV